MLVASSNAALCRQTPPIEKEHNQIVIWLLKRGKKSVNQKTNTYFSNSKQFGRFSKRLNSPGITGDAGDFQSNSTPHILQLVKTDEF